MGDLMMGDCFWSTHRWPDYPFNTSGSASPHYFHEIERNFIEQKNNIGNYYDIDNDPYDNIVAKPLGNAFFNKGFQYYQYAINDPDIQVTTYDAFFGSPGRADDAIQLKLGSCVIDDPGRMAFYDVDDSNVKITHDTKIMVYPNPFTDETTVLVKSNDFANINSLTIFDITGRDATGLFTIKKNEDSYGYTIYNKKAVHGYFIVQVKNQTGQTINTKLSIIN